MYQEDTKQDTTECVRPHHRPSPITIVARTRANYHPRKDKPGDELIRTILINRLELIQYDHHKYQSPQGPWNPIEDPFR